MCERWKDIPGYEGFYQSSDFGRVRSLPRPTTTGKVLVGIPDKDGYLVVSLSKHGKAKRHRINRLVAMSFIDNPDGLPVVNHKDENKVNNRADNLEWCTVKYNTRYHGAEKRSGLSRRIPINQFKIDGTFVRRWSGRIEIVETLGFPGGNITSCCMGHRKTASGFVWKYASTEKPEGVVE